MEDQGERNNLKVEPEVSAMISAPFESRYEALVMRNRLFKLHRSSLNRLSLNRSSLNRSSLNRSSYQEHVYSNLHKKLRAAASFNNVEAVKRLLDSGVPPDTGDEVGRTPLHIACAKGYSDVVKMLLDHKASCNKQDKIGNTPLHLAVCTTSTKTVNLLLEAGASIYVKGKHTCSPLQLAQTKLKLFNIHNQAFESVKSQAEETVSLMMKLLTKNSEEAELVEAFSKKLNMSTTSEQVACDVKVLLNGLESLDLKEKQLVKPSVLDNSLDQLEQLKQEKL